MQMPFFLRRSLLFCMLGTSVSGLTKSQELDFEGLNAVSGLWASKGSIFSIYQENGTLKAEVIAMRNPRLDFKNKRKNLRNRPVIGLQVLSRYSYDKGVWRGRIYDPESGRNYRSSIRRDDKGNLRLTAYIAFLSKTKTFHPVQSCTGNIIDMLESINLGQLCLREKSFELSG